MFNICALGDYKVVIKTKHEYEEIIDYYCDIGAVTKPMKTITRKQKTICGGKLIDLILSYLQDKDCFEVIHSKDDELIIEFYNINNSTESTIVTIKWTIKSKS